MTRLAQSIAVLAICFAEQQLIAADTTSAVTNGPVIRLSSSPGPYCGLHCVYLALRSFGHDIEFLDLLKPEFIGSKKGSSASEIIRAARSFGCHATLVEHLNASILRQVDVPVILHVKHDLKSNDYDHWILYMGISDGSARIYEGDDSPSLCTFDRVSARWNGVGILISETPISTRWIHIERLTEYTSVVLVAVTVLGLMKVLEQSWWINASAIHKAAIHTLLLTFLSALTYLACRWVDSTYILADGQSIREVQEKHLGEFLPKITRDEVISHLNDSHWAVVDARLARDFKLGHIPGAINIQPSFDRSKCPSEMADVDPQKKVIVYCQSSGCPYAVRVASLLRRCGYDNLFYFRGGWIEWSEDGEQSG